MDHGIDDVDRITKVVHREPRGYMIQLPEHSSANNEQQIVEDGEWDNGKPLTWKILANKNLRILLF